MISNFLKTTLLILIVAGCSTTPPVIKERVHNSELSRRISSTEIDKKSAYARLKILKDHIRATRDSFPIKGNPRYYLFENFDERTVSILDKLEESSDERMEQNTFIPVQKEIIDKFLSFTSAYKVMTEAGIYINYSHDAPKDNPIISQNLENLDKVYQHYYGQLQKIKSSNPHILKEEDFSNKLTDERIILLKYLSRRVELFLSSFDLTSTESRSISTSLKRIRNLKNDPNSNLKTRIKSILNSSYYQKTKKALNSIELPESGSIDGVDDSFEKAMSVQYCFELIDFVLNRQTRG